MRKKGERNTKNVDVLRTEQSRRFVNLVGRATQTTPYHLFTEKLRCKCSQAHNVGHSFGIPAFRKHSHRDDFLNLLARLPPSPDRVHCLSQELGTIFLGKPSALTIGVIIAVRFVTLGFSDLNFDRFVLCFRLLQHLRINVENLLRDAEFFDTDFAFGKGVLNTCRSLRPVGYGDHDWRRLQIGIPPLLCGL